MKITNALIAKVLRRAADEHLATEPSSEESASEGSYSCCAVVIALNKMFPGPHCVVSPWLDDSEISRTIHKFLTALGCPTGSLWAFSEFMDSDDIPKGQAHPRQGARFIWLHFAALIAEEQFDYIVAD